LSGSHVLGVMGSLEARKNAGPRSFLSPPGLSCGTLKLTMLEGEFRMATVDR
jgi:hypothetical protein